MLLMLVIFLPLAAAAVNCALGKRHWKARNESFRLFTLAALLLSAYVFARVVKNGEIHICFEKAMGLGLSFRADGFRALYACLASFMWAMTALMSERYFKNYHNRTRYYLFSLLTFMGTLGVFYSDDLYTTFVFFEIMSVSSYAWVAHDETESALRAAETYLGVAILGGMVTLMGMFLMYVRIGSLSFEALRAAQGLSGLDVAGALILFGFMAKAGAVPVQIWLPKAHPVAPAPSSALLSGMLTKTGLFGVLVISMNLYKGSFAFGCVMLALALTTMLLGAVLGVFSTNLKRTLACSSMSQIGYILTGVSASVLLGEHGALPAAGAIAHMVNHSVLKLALFMSAGVVYMNLHRLELNDIRGFGRRKPLLHIVFLLGALGLMGVPGFNGYVSKTMIHEGLVEYIHDAANPLAFKIGEWVFLFAAGLTTAYMLKLYIAIFWQKNASEARQADFDAMGKKYLDARTRVALMLAAAPIPLLGLLPNGLTARIYEISRSFIHGHALGEIEFFSLENLKGGAITLVIGALVYLFVVRKWMYSEEKGYINRWPEKLDLENLVYRPVLARMFPNLLSFIAGLMNGLGEFAAKCFMGVITFFSRLMDELTDHVVVTIREWAFVDRTEHEHEEARDGFLKRERKLFESVSAVGRKLHPEIRIDKREATDMRYGSPYTNTVTFGLVLCTIGIVFALMYVLMSTIF